MVPRISVRPEHKRPVVVVAHPEVAEAREFHLLRDLGPENSHASTAGAALVEVAVKGGSMRSGALQRPLKLEDVDNGRGPPVRVFLAQLDGTLEDRIRDLAAFSLVFSPPGSQCLDATLAIEP